MMANLVDGGRSSWRALHRSMSRVVDYVPYGVEPTVDIHCFIRGLRSDDLFASALQTDIVGIVSADDLALLLPARPAPLRYDRVHQANALGFYFTVEEWRGAPHYDQPIFFKLLLRGGTQ